MMIDAKLNRAWLACYGDTQLAELYDRPLTLREVLSRTDGPWADVPAQDRIWVASHAETMDRPVRMEWTARLVERALGRIKNPDPRSLAIIPMLRTDTVTPAALDAAWDAARDAAWDAAWAAALDAARDAALAAALDAARAAARDAAWDAARDAAWAAEYRQQIADLLELLPT